MDGLEKVLNEHAGITIVLSLTYEEKRSSYMRQGRAYPYHLVPDK